MTSARTELVLSERESRTASAPAETPAPAQCARLKEGGLKVRSTTERASERSNASWTQAQPEAHLLTVRRPLRGASRPSTANLCSWRYARAPGRVARLAPALLLALGVALAACWVGSVTRQHEGLARRATVRHEPARPIAAGWLTSADEAEIARWAR